MSFTGVPVAVSGQQAVEVAPPLQGQGWIVGNGCCDPITVHRGALLAIDGTVYAVADGTVVRVLDGQPEQTPGKLPEGQTPQTGDGNYVVLDIGNGRFAFYAHMQPG